MMLVMMRIRFELRVKIETTERDKVAEVIIAACGRRGAPKKHGPTKRRLTHGIRSGLVFKRCKAITSARVSSRSVRRCDDALGPGAVKKSRTTHGPRHRDTNWEAKASRTLWGKDARGLIVPTSRDTRTQAMSLTRRPEPRRASG
jgi:hypothetical protein